MDSPVSGFSHLQLHVGDIARSAQWYSTALGLQPFAGAAEKGYLAMAGAGGRFAIVLSPLEGDGAGQAEPSPGAGLDHLAFSITTLQELAGWAEKLTDAGIAHGGLVESGEGTSVHLVDPDGLNIELIVPARR